ncbi:MAG: RsmD family RNA methyltransferase [Sandaracinaceae bacterium]
MRIVGGTLSGRRFSGPKGDKTRPTSERVREAIASALVSRGALADAVVLDLWAGTGALAFEALSRGAERAVLVERDKRTADAIGRAAGELGLGGQTDVRRLDLDKTGWSAGLGAFDLVFCDPPYRRIERVREVLEELIDAGGLREDALVVIEHAAKDAVALPPGLAEVRTYRYGDTKVLLAAPTEERA